MLRSNNYTTILLLIIVLVLVLGVGIALYYVLDLDWFAKQPVQIYKEVQPYKEQQKIEIKVEKEIKYDTAKRAYNILLKTEELNIVIYKDGSVGITMLENEKFKEISNYKKMLNKQEKLNLSNIIRAYEVEASKEGEPAKYILLLDADGNIYKLNEKALIEESKYDFVKIEGLAKIIDIRQITNESLIENTTGVNVIAIDEESNELLLTDYLIPKSE